MIKKLENYFTNINKKQFRILFVLSFILSIIPVVYDNLFPSKILETVNKIIEKDVISKLDGATGAEVLPYILMGIFVLLVTVISIILFFGILSFKNWARKLWILLFLTFPLALFFPGIIAVSFTGNIISSFAMMLDGVITVLMFTEPISKYFSNNKK